MDYKEFNDKERAYYKQDFSCIDMLLRRIRNAFIHNVTVKMTNLNFNGVWDFNSKTNFTYITLFQAGKKPLRYGSIRSTMEDTINRCISKISASERFKEFDIDNPEKCRILLEFTIDKKLTDLKHLQGEKFTEHRFEPGITGLELKNVFSGIPIFYMPTDAVVNSQMSLNQALITMIKKTPIGKMTNSNPERIKLLSESDDYETIMSGSGSHGKYDYITVNMSKINTENKYPGFIFEKTNPAVIPTEVKTGTVIEVYYVLEGYKTIGYDINYYVNGELQLDDIVRVRDTVSINEDNYLSVDILNIAPEDKYPGFVLERTDPDPIPNTLEDGKTIDIYYVTRGMKTLSYNVEYYIDRELKLTEVHTKTVVENASDIIEVNKELINITDKYEGKFFERTNPTPIPDKVISGNTIKVYYVSEEIDPTIVKYIIEYYYDGEIDESATEYINADGIEHVSEDDIRDHITSHENGYILLKVANVVLDITNNTYQNIIKVYYVTELVDNKSAYTIEYYYDEIMDNTKTDVIVADVNEEITKDYLNNKIIQNTISGYRYSSISPEKLIVSENVEDNIIRIYYVRGNEIEERIKTSYKVEYYYDGVIDNSKTEVIEGIVGDTIVSYRNNAKEGFNFLLDINVPLRLNRDSSINVIKVYYVSVDPSTVTGYKIEYYYNNIQNIAKTDFILGDIDSEIKLENIIDKVNANRDTYDILTIVNLPLILKADVNSNVIKVFYITRGLNNTSAYRIEYYYDGIIDTTKTEVYTSVVGREVRQESIQNHINNNKGLYNLLTVSNVPLIVSSEIETNVIKVHYVSRNPEELAGYTIEYYYNETKDSSKTEIVFDAGGTIITEDTIRDKIEENRGEYNYLTTANVPLVVNNNISENVIKVFYVTEEVGPDSLQGYYKIEYYYDNVLKTAKTEVLVGLKNSKIEQSDIQSRINANRDGYNLLTIANIPLVITDNVNNNVIRVYYVTEKVNPNNPDDPNNKTGYKIEYYYDGTLNSVKTEVIEDEKDNIITKESLEEKINNNKETYNLLTVVNVPLTISSNINNNVIKVFYTSGNINPDDPDDPENTTGYRIEYYYNNILNTTKTEVVVEEKNTEITQEQIQRKIDENAGEYKFLSVINVPLIVTPNINNNVIKVYYLSENPINPDENTGYIIEYYYDGLINSSKTEVVIAPVRTTVTEKMVRNNVNKNKGDYDVLIVANVPLEVGTDINKNVIKVHYVTNIPGNPKVTGYVVEYYYDDVINPAKTDVIIEDVDTIITLNSLRERIYDNKGNNRHLKTVGVPLQVSDDIIYNVAKVYYTSSGYDAGDTVEYKTEYVIRYYYDGELDNSRTETVNVKENTTIEEQDIKEYIDNNTIDGYVVEKIENTPLKVKLNSDYNIINVYFVKSEIPDDSREYKVEYYYDGVIAPDKTETKIATLGETIESYDDKFIMGYKLEKVENLPLTLSDDSNVIKVYYKRGEYGYTVNYYYDGVIDEEKTDSLQAVFGTEITNYNEKQEANYELEKVENLPLVITTNEESNVINVYYVTRTTDIKIKYIDRKDNQEISESKTISGKIGQDVNMAEYEKEIEDYVLVLKPESNTKFEENNKEIKYYYAHVSEGVKEQHIDSKSGEILYEAKHEGNEGDSYKIVPKEFKNYKLVESNIPTNAEGELGINLTEVKYYYEKIEEEKPDEEKPEEKPNEEKPNEEKPNEEKPNEEKPNEEKPNEEKPNEEKPNEEKPNENKTNNENSTSEKSNENRNTSNNSNNSNNNSGVQNSNNASGTLNSGNTTNSANSTNKANNINNNVVNNSVTEEKQEEKVNGLNTGDTVAYTAVNIILVVIITNIIQIIAYKIIGKEKFIK